MPTVRVGAVDLYYEETGTGDAIVWIPGTGLLGTTWSRQVDHFSHRHRCITVDLRGSGRTEGGGTDFTVGDMADDIAGALDALGVRRAVAVGLSLGSAVVQELAVRRPDLVRAAVLLATWSSSAGEHHIRRHFESRLYALEHGPVDVFAQFAFWMSAPSLFDHEPELQSRVEAELGQHLSTNLAGTAAHFRADLSHETCERLPRVACPTLVLHGTEDLITLPWYNERVAALIPGAQLRTVTGAGHLAWLERPDEINGHVEQFVSALPPDPGTAP